MRVIDAGHVYQLNADLFTGLTRLVFVKRGGGSIQYENEWPGIQTQAVMRAVISHLETLMGDSTDEVTYPLWQLGLDTAQNLTLSGVEQISDILDVLIDRSRYLNAILPCVETQDAISWLELAKADLCDIDLPDIETLHHAQHYVRLALWSYEARAYRRKQEKVNRQHPAHDDSARLRAWRNPSADDVPFDEDDIELRPIGPDGHIVLT